MTLSDTSLKWRVAFLFQFVGFFCMVAAVASTYMVVAELIPNKFQHMGFWDICFDTRTFGCQDMIEYLKEWQKGQDWVHGCRAMVVIGLIIEALSLLVSLWLAYVASGIHIGNLFVAIGNFASVIVCLIGGLVFTFNGLDVLQETLEMDADPSWSFAVFIIAQGLYFFSGLLQIYDACTAD